MPVSPGSLYNCAGPADFAQMLSNLHAFGVAVSLNNRELGAAKEVPMRRLSIVKVYFWNLGMEILCFEIIFFPLYFMWILPIVFKLDGIAKFKWG